MAIFEYTTQVPRPPGEVFDFLARPRNLHRIMPPTPRFEIVDAPERLTLGSRFTAKVWKFGLSRLIVSEITWFEEGVGFTDQQIQGPFGRWVHTHTVGATADGTLMLDRIDFEPPSGLIGCYLTESRLRRELAAAFAYREKRFAEQLAASDASSKRR